MPKKYQKNFFFNSPTPTLNPSGGSPSFPHAMCSIVLKKKKKRNDSGFKSTSVFFSILVIFLLIVSVWSVATWTVSKYQKPCWPWSSSMWSPSSVGWCPRRPLTHVAGVCSSSARPWRWEGFRTQNGFTVATHPVLRCSPWTRVPQSPVVAVPAYG